MSDPSLSEQFEKWLVGSLLANPKFIVEARGLEPLAFNRDDLRAIFRAMLAIDSEGKPLDLVSVAVRLEEDGTLGEVGGPLVLKSLADDAPYVIHVGEWCEKIRDTAERRRLACDALAVSRMAGDAGVSTESLRDRLLASANNLSHNGKPRTHATAEAIVVRLCDVEEQEVEWLWPNRIPLGKLTLLAGDPGLGKSFVTVDMAARVSTGAGWPDCYSQNQPIGSVIMFNCEDDIADTVLPRLKRAGGDPSKVIALQGVTMIDAETGHRRQRGFSLDADLPKLIEVLEENRDVRLVVIDPVSAYCGATDSHKNADIRAMLAPMADMASKYRVAIVMVTHLSKGSGGKAVYRAMGSLAFAAAARAVWHVAKDHDDDKRRLILLAKINISEESTGLAYRLQDGAVCWEETPIVMTADEHLEKETQPERKPRGNGEQGQAVQQVKEWLVEKLTGCSMLAKTVKQLADDADIAPATLKRAKRLAAVKSERIGFGQASVVWWTLPSDDTESVPADVDEAEAARLFPSGSP